MPTEKETVKKVGQYMLKQAEVLGNLAKSYGSRHSMHDSTLLRAQHIVDNVDMIFEHFGIKPKRNPGEEP